MSVSGMPDVASRSSRCSLLKAILTMAGLWVANWQLWHKSQLWCSLAQIGRHDNFQLMRDLLLLAIHLLVTQHRSQPRLLVIWGKHDPSFDISEPEAYRRDVPAAEVHVLDGGHFALDTAADEIATLIRNFLGKSR
jgi:pimeloyl-ACP methyl ester carboxylesterase